MDKPKTKMELKKGDRVYFMGMGGTGMASVAGLAQQAGFDVLGSDTNIYPPMSTMLEELNIPVLTPYSPDNVLKSKSKLVIVANALSRQHPELEAMIEAGTPYTSFPAFLGDHFLEKRTSLVVTGTHGKTTTASLLAHILVRLNWEPGYLIGGIPRTLKRSFDLGKGPLFVIEGDEYDTAFFDKHSKFLHYRPKYVILNNLEFDHADIFANLEAVEAEFSSLLRLVHDPECVIANIDDTGVASLLKRLDLENSVTSVATQSRSPSDGAVRLLSLTAPGPKDQGLWQLRIQIPEIGSQLIKTQLAGHHNAANICQIIACLWVLAKKGDIPDFPFQAIQEAIHSFTGVKRRLDRLDSIDNIEIFEDFAHHPTAVRAVIESMRALFPEKRLIVAFEPKNATSRRNIFMKDFASSLRLADKILIGACPQDQRIPSGQRMNTREMASLIGANAQAFEDNEALLDKLVNSAETNDTILFMSSGSFSGIQYRLGQLLAQRRGPSHR